jgi:hypothetical protein
MKNYKNYIIAICLIVLGYLSPELLNFIIAQDLNSESIGVLLAVATAAYTTYQETRHKKIHGSLRHKEELKSEQTPPKYEGGHESQN